jgi:hypothetical protein
MQLNKRNFIGKVMNILMLILIAVIIISCSEDDNDNNSPTIEKPIITLVSPDTNYVNCGYSEFITIDLFAQSSLTSGKSLTNFKITSKFGNGSPVIVMDTAISDNEFVLNDYIIVAHNETGTEIWTFRITDVSGEYEEVKLTLNITYYTPPSLVLLSGEYQPGIAYISSDTTLVVSKQFAIGITANSTSDENLKSVFITRVFENVDTDTLLNISINNNTFTLDTLTAARTNPGTEDFYFRVTDKNNQSTTIGFTIITEPAPPNFVTYNDRILGAQGSNIGGSFATSDGAIYTLDEAKINSDKVDFLYFYDDNNHATIAAPDDADAATVFTGINGLANWTVQNPSKFKMTTHSSSDFDQIQTSSQLVTAATLPTYPNLSKVNNFTNGKVLAFQTADLKYGLIRIDNISGTSDGTIEITVKVQY